MAAWFISGQEHRRQTKAKQTAATYQVAVQLKQWLAQLEDGIMDVENAEPNPHGEDRAFVFIKEFPFEASLDLVSALGAKQARSVFELIADKQLSNRSAHFLVDVADPYQASDSTFENLERIYPAAIALCNEFETSVGWPKTEAEAAVAQTIKSNAAKARHKPIMADEDIL